MAAPGSQQPQVWLARTDGLRSKGRGHRADAFFEAPDGAFLSKPFTTAALLRAVDDLLRRQSTRAAASSSA